MSDNNVAIDLLLAAALRGQNTADFRPLAATDSAAAILERINYHGIAGLLCDLPEAMAGWPSAVVVSVRDGAVAHGMWELRHRRS